MKKKTRKKLNNSFNFASFSTTRSSLNSIANHTLKQLNLLKLIILKVG